MPPPPDSPAGPPRWPVDRLTDHLARESDALVDEILRLAAAAGYTDQTSSMRAAWVESVERVTACLGASLGDPNHTGGANGHHDYGSDPRFAGLRDVAWRHRRSGVPLALNHGLLKYYRRAYLDLCGVLYRDPAIAAGLPPRDPLMARLDLFFDEVELVMLSPWSETGTEEAAMADRLRRLARERDQLFGVLESLRGPVFIADEEGVLISANRAALQTFLGLDEAGALFYRLALQSRRTELQPIVDEILATEGAQWSAIWLQTHAGSRCFDIRLRMVEDTVYKLDRWRIVLMNDVTDHQRAIEQAREAERMMSLFLAAMSHEIRTPLHSVLGAAELLRDLPPGEFEERRRLSELLDISARGLSATLENVLSFSRFEHQAPKPRPAPVALAEALENLVRSREILARQQGVPLMLSMPADLPDPVSLDWSMVQQILGNLIQNAIRHDDGRGVGLDVARQGDRLVFSVTDHGPGLPDQIRDMLAAPPAALRPRPTGQSGSGLGLAIAQRMTLALGGEIAVAGSKGDGARLEVRLPLIEAAVPVLPAAPSRPDGALASQSCLLIDDDPVGVLVTVAMLERMGLSVDHARSLGQAAALCQAHPENYDLFVVDYRLPDGNGVDFARSLQNNPALAGRPVFLLSANVDLVRHAEGQASLFAALLEKPLDAGALGRAIRSGTRPVRPSALLDGISPAAQARMAEAFAAGWQAFQTRLAATGDADPDAALAGQAHKLANGAAIFGRTELHAALRRFEQIFEEPAATPQMRASARARVLAAAPPTEPPPPPAGTGP
ncbi:ATP-binding protein [Rhodovulum kholense]|uniref:histidine kinase n=1 Tax=Rhodovulum kholense TaxID=453584 RepID=A0A8E3ARH5_9RHOB|nr:ATP-binding protein [Rhodovulum kholense]PTW50454.1 two-component system aerobic respiration control sensor histidine kinase ArcB [Rhodovulum kholense]